MIAHLNRGELADPCDIIRTELVFIIIGQSSFFWFFMHERSAEGEGCAAGLPGVSKSITSA